MTTIAAGTAGIIVGWVACGFLKPTATNAADSGGRPDVFLAPVAGPVRGFDQSWLSPQMRDQFQRELTTVDDCRAALNEPDVLMGVHPLVVSTFRDRALRRWIDLDPADALAYAEDELRGKYRRSLANDLFRVWLDLDVESAMDALAKASPALVDAAVPKFLEQLAQIDPKRAFEETQGPKWRLTGNDAAAVNRILAIWARQDPEEAAEKALSLDPSYYTGGMVASSFVAEAWAKFDPLAALEFFKKHDAEERVIGAFVGYLSKNDPSQILELRDKYADFQFTQIMRGWAGNDPEGAIDYARSLPEDDPLRTKLMNQAAKQIATSDPERALSIFSKSDGSGVADLQEIVVLRQAFTTLAAADFDVALERWKGSPSEQRVGALSGIMLNSFTLDQEAACRQCRKLLDNPDTAESVIPALSIALSWGHGGGPYDLTEIVTELPELGPVITGDLLDGWVSTAPESAAEFIAERVAESRGDEIGEADSVTELSIARPEFMSQWLQTLPEGAFRNNAATALVANWYRIDPSAVASWIQTLPEGPMRAAADSQVPGTDSTSTER